MADEFRPARAAAGRSGAARRWIWRALRAPDPVSLRGREHRVVRWIGAGRRNKARAASADPRDANVIDLTRARTTDGDRETVPGGRQVGGGNVVVNLTSLVRSA